MDPRIEEALSFWFGPPAAEGFPSGEELWFGKSARVDRELDKRFGRVFPKAKAGQLDAWASTPRGRLALILICDEFARRMFRDTPEMFSGNEKALSLCLDGLDDNVDKKLTATERCFFYAPAMHAEDVDIQLTSVEVYGELREAAPPDHRALCERFLRLAERSREVLERFERFPNRNAILGRSSTSEEATFLQQSGELSGEL
jgi:uncharacterized protein (DUF924 family)